MITGFRHSVNKIFALLRF